MARERTARRNESSDRSDLLVAEVVQSRRRRYALYYLHEQSGPVPLEDVARQVSAWERCDPSEEVRRGRPEAVYSSLKRTHVPRLEAYGLVTYDPRSDRVTCDVDDPSVAVCLANDYRTSVPWHLVYLVLTAASTGFLLLVRSDVSPFPETPPILVAAVIVTAFAAASAAHWYDVYRWHRRTEDEPPDFLVTFEENATPPDEDRESEEYENEDRENEDGGDGESATSRDDRIDRP